MWGIRGRGRWGVMVRVGFRGRVGFRVRFRVRVGFRDEGV